MGPTPQIGSYVRAADTNILVRLLTRDDPAQTEAAEALLKDGPLWVSHVVLAETAWVLEKGYERPKDQIFAVMTALVDNQDIHVDEPAVVAAALASFGASSAGFSDCLILEVAKSKGHLPLATFDRKLAKLPGAFQVKVRAH